MKKRWRRTGRVLVALLLAVCSLSVNLSPVLAVTQADIDALKDDAGDLSAQRKELEKKLDALADDKSSAMERKNLLDQQIANTSAQISNVEAQISKYASLISEKEQELAEAEEQEAAQYELFCQRQWRRGAPCPIGLFSSTRRALRTCSPGWISSMRSWPLTSG